MQIEATSRWYRGRRGIRGSILAALCSLFVLSAAYPSDAQLSIETLNITSGLLYTIVYNEPFEYWTDKPIRKPCAGRVLTYLDAFVAVFFRQPGPTFPLPVWRAQAVKGRPGQFTFEAVNRTKGVALLAYPSTACEEAPSNVILAKPGTSGFGFRWKVYRNDTYYASMSWVLQAVDRKCPGICKEIAGPDAVVPGWSCDPPYKGVRLWKDPGNFTDGMTWGLQPFAAYPATLTGTRVPGRPSYLTGDPVVARADDFGRALAMRGNVLAVGQMDGAYAFTRRSGDAWGVWQRHRMLRPKNAGMHFGSSIAVGAGYVVVGSKGYDNYKDPIENIKNADKAQVYVYLSKDWNKPPYMLPKPQNASAQYGRTVVASGNSVAVADPGLGNVFVYTRINSVWSAPQAVLRTHTPECCLNVALAADTLVTEDGSNVVVFARKEGVWRRQDVFPGRQHWWTSLQLSESGNTLAIWADVYNRAPNGTWALLQTIPSTDISEWNGGGDYFSFVVRAFSGEDLLVDGLVVQVEAPDMFIHEANAWVRESPGGLFVKKAPLEVPYRSVRAHDGFGSVAAAAGDFIVVGAPDTIDPPNKAIISGNLYTISYYENVGYSPSDPRKPCAGRVLTYDKGSSAASRGKLWLQVPGPVFPLVSWRAQAVKGRPGEFTFEAINRTEGAPAQLLAYYTDCRKRDVFLAAPGTKGVAFRFKVYDKWKTWYASRWALEVAGRRCAGAASELVGAQTVANGSSCDPPNAGVGLWKHPTGDVTSTMRWAIERFVPYPAVLTGDRVPVGTSSIGERGEYTLSDGFGVKVSLRGNTMAVSQWGPKHYVFTRKPSDAWGTWRRQLLSPPKQVNNLTFVAVGSGFIAATGSYIKKPKEGRYIFVYTTKSSWYGNPVVLPKPKAAKNAGFGGSIAADDDTVAIADPGLGNIFTYLRKSDGSWSQPQAVLPVNSPNCCKTFALAAGTLVTHSACDGGALCGASKALVFVRRERGWALLATLNATLPEYDLAYFTIDESGSTLAVDNAIYTRNGTAWALLQTLEHAHIDGADDERHGVRALSGNLLFQYISAVSMPHDAWYECNVWERDGPGGLYVNKTSLKPPVASTGRWGSFGSVVGASGDLIAVAEPGYPGSQYSAPLLGSVFVYNSKLL